MCGGRSPVGVWEALAFSLVSAAVLIAWRFQWRTREDDFEVGTASLGRPVGRERQVRR